MLFSNGSSTDVLKAARRAVTTISIHLNTDSTRTHSEISRRSNPMITDRFTFFVGTIDFEVLLHEKLREQHGITSVTPVSGSMTPEC